MSKKDIFISGISNFAIIFINFAEMRVPVEVEELVGVEEEELVGVEEKKEEGAGPEDQVEVKDPQVYQTKPIL